MTTGDQSSLVLRSMLFVPGDSDKKLAKSATVAADALILDLEDAVDPARKPAARKLVAEFLQRRGASQPIWVRVNSLDDAACADDLAAVVPARPDGIVLPKVRSPEDVELLAKRLEELEQRSGMQRGVTKILPIATETASAVLSLAGYTRSGPRLAGLTWGAEDLSVALGAAANVDERGDWLPPYQLARSLCLLAAAAAGVAAIDTPYTDFRNAEGLARQAAEARRDGFTGKLAIHPSQVPIINEAFRPDAEEVAVARRIVAAFDAAAGAGVVAIDGKMLDRPHLTRARRTLRLAATFAERGALRESS
jgi:citrate lyase subunit beta / citryl-CoA lyase